MSVTLQPVTPPRRRYRTGAIGEAEARKAVELFESHEWVSDGEAYKTRPAAAHRAKRMLDYLRELEPESSFASKTWPDGRRFRWAVRRVGAPKSPRRKA